VRDTPWSASSRVDGRPGHPAGRPFPHFYRKKTPASLKAPRTQSFSTLSSNPFLNNNLAGADFCKMIDSKMTENSI